MGGNDHTALREALVLEALIAGGVWLPDQQQSTAKEPSCSGLQKERVTLRKKSVEKASAFILITASTWPEYGCLKRPHNSTTSTKSATQQVWKTNGSVSYVCKHSSVERAEYVPSMESKWRFFWNQNIHWFFQIEFWDKTCGCVDVKSPKNVLKLCGQWWGKL